MDPILIVKSTKDLIVLCFKVSEFLNNAKTVEVTFRLLSTEVRNLSDVLGYLGDALDSESPAPKAVYLRTEHDQEYWRLVSRSMEDCRETLESLRKTVEGAYRGEGSGLLRRPRMQLALDMQSGEIQEFRQRITAFTNTMQIALQLITMCDSLFYWTF